MADAAEIPKTTEGENPVESAVAVDMQVEAVAPAPVDGVHKLEENGTGKRGREEEEGGGEDDRSDGGEETTKKQKVEVSVEEERLEKLEQKTVEEGPGEGEVVGDGEEKEKVGPVSLGPKFFGSAVEMFEYFFKFLHAWAPNLDINKYEHMVFMDLINKGHAEPEKKIGEGIQAFQVRNHPLWKSRCFFLVRVDGSSDDFSFRKCVDRILPLPENMKAPVSKKTGREGRGDRGGRGGRGRGIRGRRGRFGK